MAIGVGAGSDRGERRCPAVSRYGARSHPNRTDTPATPGATARGFPSSRRVERPEVAQACVWRARDTRMTIQRGASSGVSGDRSRGVTVGDSLSVALRLFWRRLGILLTANVLWLGLSLLIVTWPAATAGLYYLVRRVVDEELEAAPRYARLGDFWEGFRKYGVWSSVLSVINVLSLFTIVMAFLFWIQSPTEPLRWLVGPVALCALAWAGAQLYLYALMIHRPERRPWDIAREAFLIAISYPSFTISLLLTSFALTVGCIVLAGPVFLVFFSMMAMIQTVALRVILVRRGEIVAVELVSEGQKTGRQNKN